MVMPLVDSASSTVDASRAFPLGVSTLRPGPAADGSSGGSPNVAVYAPGVRTLEIAYQAPGGSWRIETLPNVTDGVHHAQLDQSVRQ